MKLMHAKHSIFNERIAKCQNETNNKYCNEHDKQYKYETKECLICYNKISKNKQIPLKCGHWSNKIIIRRHINQVLLWLFLLN